MVMFAVTSLAQAQSWQVNNSFANDPLGDIHFITPTIGFVVGDGNTIYRTTDAGDNWTATVSPQIMTDVEFPNPAVGYVCGLNGAFMKTTDGGATWTTSIAWTTDHLTEMSFVSVDTGYMVSYNTTNYAVQVWKTVNGAMSWSIVSPNITNNTVHDVCFVNNLVGFVAQMGGAIIKSTYNGGATWNSQNVGPTTGILGIDFINDTVGFAVGHSGGIYRTTNQGLTWIQQASPTTEILRTVFFLDSLNGWICGYTGTMLHTVNGGLTWTIQSIPVTDQIVNMFMITPTYGWACTGIQFGGGDVLKYGNYFSSDSANIIRGTVHADYNTNCTLDAGDGGQVNWFVKATPGPYYGVTDNAGNYEILVPPGTYMVEQILPTTSGLQAIPCAIPNYTVAFPGLNGDTTGFDFLNSIELCPYLVTDIASDRRRRCRRNNTSIYYWNLGYASATNAEVHVDFPAYVVPVSSSVPWTLQPDSTYLFNIGVIPPQTAGSINIVDSVVCGMDSIRGFTQCTEAWITPWNTCPAPSMQWDGSNIETSGECLLNGYLRFTIKNNGQAMSDSAEYRMYMNTQLIRTRNYMLAAGDSINLLRQTNGQTFRIEADQHPDHPTKSQSNATIEGCTVDTTGNYVTGYVAQLPPDEEDAETSIHCLQIIDAFDPNEKSVEPGGITSIHAVQPGTRLDYLIHFQNCGTDTAFDIVLIDTLSPYLDVTTLHFGAASHPYTTSFLPGVVPIVKFTFQNILLPDSSTNEPGSNGFVSYSVYPDSACPLNTVIENFADIYFDFNLPVRTDTAWITLSTFQPSGNSTDSVFTQWPLIVGPDTICAGDTALFFVLGDGPVWWANAFNPSVSLSTSFTFEPILSGPQTFIVHTANGVDSFYVEVIDCASLVAEHNAGSAIQLAPNPADGELLVSSTGNEQILMVGIYNQAGQLVLTKSAGASNVVVNTSELPVGIYTAVIQLSDSQMQVRKVVIVR